MVFIMIKLCFIITGLSIGGAETMLYKLLQQLDRTRFLPIVVSLTTKGEIGGGIESMGIPVHALGMRPGVPNLILFSRLVKLLRVLKPDLVHTWMYHADLLGGLAARFAGVGTIAWCIRHSDLSPGQNKRSTLLVMKMCAKFSRWLPQRIVSCSDRARAIHVAAGYCAEKFLLIPNGFDLDKFLPDANARASVREELGLPFNTQLVGLVARYDPQKNHLGFVEAAAEVHRVLPQVHFVLAGTNIVPENSALAQAISRAGLQECFHLLGRRDDIPRLMASLDVLASSSFGEAFPNVLGEAMACGVPCVVTDVGDSAEIVGDTGRVVPPGDMTGLARCLIELLQLSLEQRLALGVRARERIRANYDIGNVVKRYEDFYMQLSSEGI
ncbi:Glycosyltransferase involved in cell wall bisynthesis [Thermomonas hydrothermalis]|uniref:Glycosyltransferase involved in cell wall bisynthesis n=2 Tax=Thermomonas hydrothermalis TaxID=213588 RepID=A0A1M4U758_9GAMM|nr:Glycosyltransferase involved in cell wall bisynthesis [Thermomonas hydrothermalis]